MIQTEKIAVSQHTRELLVFSIAVVSAPHFLHIAWLVAVISLFALGWRFWQLKTKQAEPKKWLLALLMVASFMAVFSHYGTVLGLQAGVALLVVMSALKTLEIRSYRDAMLSVYLAYFVIITNFFHSQAIPIALYMVLAVILTTVCLIRLNSADYEISLKQQFRTAGIWLLSAIPLMIILFFLFPRLNAPLWALPKHETQGLTGLSEEMEPGSISNLLQSNEVAFRVTFDDDIPSKEQRYWRGPILWTYNGKVWQQSNQSLRNLGRVTRFGEPVDYTVELEPHGLHWMLALDLPMQAPTDAIMTTDGQIKSKDPIRKVKQYKVRSYPSYILSQQLTPLETTYSLRLPRNTAPQAKALAEQWRQENPEPQAIVQKALDYFRNEGFSYTLNPAFLFDDPVDEFLFDTQEGFCEHYASSFVVLMRHAGIPARVVTGYQGGNFNPISNYLLVRQSDAHAWAEVWLENRGWVRIDPTAAVSPDRIELGINAALGQNAEVPNYLKADYFGSLAADFRFAMDSMRHFWNRWVVSFDHNRQKELLNAIGLENIKLQGLALLLAGTISAITLLGLALMLWRERQQLDPIASSYQRFLRKLEKINLGKHTAEGSRDHCQRIVPCLSDDSALQAQEIERLYRQLRFYPVQEQKNALLQMKKIINQFRPVLKKSSN